MQYMIQPVATVSNSRKTIKDDLWGEIISTIELSENLHEESLKGIEDFSHIEIIFYFDQVSDDQIQYEARHPRNNQNYPKVGIFAQRGKNRPNKIGITMVELVEVKQRTLIVKGLDAIDGTPIIDMKPVMKEFLPKGVIKQPAWSTDLMKAYWE
ncbi:tRNA (N6-threonylcarbamoyladenosine(37)-N6)-methyltransferase TrmO [Lysinibacillus fusiformis]|uniref:tRNA (N6-threonylcarbamoyladenosine(37)-N6)-methyltransferase TrmO n=1 Tax=Lysinibacillus fusiformis TaxID=28031 RepID=UPI000505B3D2|nr:tRNA (N6-threonylcarbamoyladenosine(37)-N6)-methyltransferase TrmO [Lysinibacillus fusiformis]KGA81396.1 transcriptional regulator [Lysinibacillus fusiformis]MCK1988489.1 tRNA (N6-threonylcarbamoyladenosine(37)-N6)-methyltransferase TrmO [Lysinibacillus fusiformis]QEA01290.1 tRNA (N6-threonylcarbamoyladenosine(37)-N6)-methyltransferase TrmO [Lysinibacillus fusiformis]